MIHFRVDGPFEIEPTRNINGHVIDRIAIEKFWEQYSEHAESTGCYVFGFRAGHGMVPAYVGQAKTGFKHECFESHKLAHYHNAMTKRRSGTPIMFFVSREHGSTASFDSCIDHVERLLIQFALSRNPKLENKQLSDWSIRGVYRSPGGEPSDAAKRFRELIGLFPHRTPSEEADEESAELGVNDQSPNDVVSGA